MLDRTDGTGQIGQRIIGKMTARKGQPGQDSRRERSGQEREDRAVRIKQPGQKREDRTART
jgi:hypothetical protein